MKQGVDGRYYRFSNVATEFGTRLRPGVVRAYRHADGGVADR
ncbi:hypothetical protein [Halobellus sp. GM3]